MKINQNINIVENKQDQKMKQKFDEYSSLFAKKLLEEQYKQIKLTKGVGSEIYKSLYIDTLSKEFGGKIGISEILYQDYIRNKNARKN